MQSPQLLHCPKIRYTPTELFQEILASVKPFFYGKDNFASRIITVEGEVANTPATYSQSVVYFNLKDKAGCSLNIRTYKNAFSFDMESAKGSKVEVTGVIDLSEKQSNNGNFDLLFKATKVTLIGEGEIVRAERSLVQELEEMGYFSSKAPLPSFAEIEVCHIGIVSSNTSVANAFEDIRQTLASIPFFQLELIPVSLYSAESIAKSIQVADRMGKNILIVARGGGDRLDTFNERAILDAVFKASTPVISAVGHAKDRTLIDRVADISAGTPTEAAKILSDQYLSMVARREYTRLQSENEKLNKMLHQLGQDYGKQGQVLEQMNKTISEMRKSRGEKDQGLEKLARDLEKARKTNLKLGLIAAGIVVVAVAAFILVK